MEYQKNFKRYELKYLITYEEKEKVLTAIEPYMARDKYGKSEIRNIYFDTDNYRLIRRSIEKPTYKEKLRVRSYGKAASDSLVFVELKKKYESVVYKRRISLAYENAMRWLSGEAELLEGQIPSEIEYFMKYYGEPTPKAFISYEREAYYMRDGTDFRVTFDDNILARDRELSLSSEAYGSSLLPEGNVLMEIKCSGGIPLWMVGVLSQERIYKTSFSKYGTFYKNEIINKEKN